MKARVSLFSVVVLLLLFNSCGPRNGMTEPEPYYTLMRFTDSMYRNNVIINRVYDGDTCYYRMMRGNQCIGNPNHMDDAQRHWEDYDIPERPRDPYWELPDGWYLVDWAWRNFPYTNLTLLTEMTWDEYDGNADFDPSMPHINSGFVAEVRLVPAQILMEYSHPDGNYPMFESLHNGLRNEYWFLTDMNHTRALNNTGDCLCEHAEKWDEFWAYIQTELAAAINNGFISPKNE